MPDKNNYFHAITRVSRALGTTLDRDQILHLIVRSAVDTMQGKAAALFLVDEGEGISVPVAQIGLSKNYSHAVVRRVRELEEELLEKGFIHYLDATTDPKTIHHEMKKKEGIVSLLLVPVMVKGKMIGTLCLYTAEKRKFTDREVEFLTILAEHGGMAIEHARIVEKMRNANRTILEVASSLNASLDLKDILQVLTANVAQALGVKAATIRLLDDDRKTLNLVASYGLSEKYLNKGPISAEKSIAEALEGKPVVVRDASLDKGVQYKEEKREEGIVSILCVPIKAKEEVIGVLRLYSATPRKFNEDEIMDVTAVASLGGLAIQNAGLYLMLKSDMKELKDEIWLHRSWF